MSTPGERFNHLVEIMRTLRSPEGCPWDREQTLQSLRPYLLEETYEVLEAIDAGDMDELKEELGDLVFEAVFLAQVCEEAEGFSIAEALETVATKLIRRHPHVFGEGEKARTAEEVLGRWQQLKRDERAQAGASPGRGILTSVPKSLPGLLRAYEYGSRAATAGFDWPRAQDVVSKIREEVDEIAEALTDNRDAGRVEEEVGDLLFAVANLSRKLGVEPESALRRANDKFAARFGQLERRYHDRGVEMNTAGLDALEQEWDRVKRGE